MLEFAQFSRQVRENSTTADASALSPPEPQTWVIKPGKRQQ